MRQMQRAPHLRFWVPLELHWRVSHESQTRHCWLWRHRVAAPKRRWTRPALCHQAARDQQARMRTCSAVAADAMVRQ
jgi:hypothetical protein